MAHAEYPESFRCPLSRSLMRDPVTAADGHSYERGNIVHTPIKLLVGNCLSASSVWCCSTLQYTTREQSASAASVAACSSLCW